METLLETATVVPAVNQIEFHPYLQRANGYVQWLQGRGITVQGFFGLLPITWAKGGPLDGVLREMAGRKGVSESAVLARWGLNKGVVCITTARSEGRFGLYFGCLGLVLSEEEMAVIDRVGGGHHVRMRFPEMFDAEDRS